MNQNRNWTMALVAALALTPAAGCSVSTDTTDPEPDRVAAALELDNGGLDAADEAPEFGEPELLAAASDPVLDHADPLLADPASMAMLSASGVAVTHVALVWGQIPGNPGAESRRDWSGVLRVSRGLIAVRRVIRFEDPTDRVLPRTEPSSVAFSSVTGPSQDGLILTIADPSPGSPDPQTLSYTGDTGTVVEIEIADLLGRVQTAEVDDAGNRVVAAAVRRPAAACEHGFLAGRWHRLRDGLGVFMGRVVDESGSEIGHVRGLYGQRRHGERVFFGKYIDQDGRFRGLLRGQYSDGRFTGHWIAVDGSGERERGVVGGQYRETAPDTEMSGYFLGRWGDSSCETDEAPAP